MKLKETLLAGAWITAVVFVVNFLFGMIKIPVKELFGITAVSPYTTTIGAKVIGILQNIVPINVPLPQMIMNLVLVFIGATLIWAFGTVIYGAAKVPQASKAWTKATWTMVWGVIPFYILLIGLKLPAINTMIGLLIYVAVCALTWGVAKNAVNKIL